MGKPFMPWQHQVMDTALEIDPATGFLVYREIVLTIPRQSGKTTVTLPRVVWRGEAAHMLGGRQTMLYTAQTGLAARKKWEQEFCEELLDPRSIMRKRVRKMGSTGRERLRFSVSGSTFSPIATMETSGHGDVLDDGTLDEAFAQTDNTVEAAWRPAMITRNWAQMWIVSTAGTPKSTYLKGKVRRGRELVISGEPSQTAYFEWSLPKELDPGDPENWKRCMPALGHTIRIANIQHEYDTIEGGLPEFRRAYLNQWADEFDDLEWIIPKASWWAMRDEASRRVDLPVLSADVTPTRSRAAVSYAAHRADGLPMVQCVRSGEGAAWIPEAIGDLVRSKGASEVVIDSVGPVHNMHVAIAEQLKELRMRVPLRVLKTGEVADAWSDFEDGAATHQFRHLNQAVLNAALAGAATRKIGARNALDARSSLSDITPLVAAVNAHHALLHPLPKREFFMGTA